MGVVQNNILLFVCILGSCYDKYKIRTTMRNSLSLVTPGILIKWNMETQRIIIGVM